MVFLTLMIGVLNLCLGYALAVNLGYGPPSLQDAWRAMSATPAPVDPPTHQEVSEVFVLDAWKVALADEASRMGVLEDRLRNCEEQPDRETIRECVSELQKLCEATLREQGEAAERFENRFDESDELGAAGKELEEATFEQLAQLETTISNLRQADLEFDLAATGTRLIGEIERGLAASRRLWNGLNAAFPPAPSINAG